MKIWFTMLLTLSACGGVTPTPTTVADNQNEETEAAPPTRSSLPDDFSIRAGGGPVAGWMARGMTMDRYRIEPRVGAPGSFDVVHSTQVAAELGVESPLREVGRSPVPTEDIEALHALVMSRRAELEQPCMDPRVMDGGTSSFAVRSGGDEALFQCTNASTPAFAALAEAFHAIVRAHLSADAGD